MNTALLRICCFLFGHGEIKVYWRTIGENVQASEKRCELCGKVMKK
jgi:hypothetical protein